MLKFLIGIAAGTGIGLLIAPRAGVETRARLSEIAQNPQEKVNQALDSGVDQMANVGERLGRMMGERVASAIRDNTGLESTEKTA
jgi:gas vesicle protein